MKEKTGTGKTGLKKTVLDSRIYKGSALRAAISEYSEVADVKMEEKDGKYLISISNYPDELKNVIAYEFCNYVLWKLNN